MFADRLREHCFAAFMEGVHLYMGNQLSHYFIEDDSLPPDIQTFPYYFGAEKFMFTSDAGMFSPGHVDEASSLLLHTMPKRTGRFLDLGCGYGAVAYTHQTQPTTARV